MNPASLPYVFYVVAAALLVGLARVRRLAFPQHLILLILAIYTVNEVYCNNEAEQGRANTPYYNFVMALTQLITLTAYSLFTSGSFRKLGYACTLLLALGSAANMIWGQAFRELQTFSLVPGGFIIAVYSYLYLRNVLVEQDPPVHDIFFWFMAANLLYYILATPTLALVPWLLRQDLQLTSLLMGIFNKTSYTLWAVLLIAGFLWMKKATSSS